MSSATVCSGSACDDHPQVCVDWCDASAYCSSLGKRLCRRIGGGMNPFDRFADPGSSEWMNGCSAGGQYEYGPSEATPLQWLDGVIRRKGQEGRPAPGAELHVEGVRCPQSCVGGRSMSCGMTRVHRPRLRATYLSSNRLDPRRPKHHASWSRQRDEARGGRRHVRDPPCLAPK
ncbi:MAG: SUMF1/EgtB/PvdO family nonheme iron enzyme [Polyangiaceae bacterium]